MDPEFTEQHRWKTWQILLLGLVIILVMVGMDQLLKPIGDIVHKTLSGQQLAPQTN